MPLPWLTATQHPNSNSNLQPQDLIDENQWPLRDYALFSSSSCTPGNPNDEDEGGEPVYCGTGRRFEGYGKEQGRGPLLDLQAVKIYLDGALGSWGE